MNIALEQTNEIVDGKVRRNYGDAFVRGNNGMLLTCGWKWRRDEMLMFAMQSCTSPPTHRLRETEQTATDLGMARQRRNKVAYTTPTE